MPSTNISAAETRKIFNNANGVFLVKYFLRTMSIGPKFLSVVIANDCALALSLGSKSISKLSSPLTISINKRCSNKTACNNRTAASRANNPGLAICVSFFCSLECYYYMDTFSNRAKSMKISKSDRIKAAAIRALEEAKGRKIDVKKANQELELGGPKGLEPTRYGDWERKGIASDF